ncbi:MAG: helix-turn-helix transcriptional regulator [Candidatus Eremiobacteraeota bacterium]|nr:helix-turn-helix transcriptional regulator [Candidatus Eremiobacteraeota bacterium]
MTLTPTAFNVLVAVADGELHGYAIMQEIDRLTEGTEAVGPTTLYRSIRQMLAAGLLEEVGRPNDGDERRRYYRITAAGRRSAIAEADRLDRLARLARSKRALKRRLA